MSHAEVKWYGDRVINQVDTAIQAAMMKAVLMVEADAKRLCPVDTGRLRASITHQIKQITRDIIQGKVGSNVEYAPYVELSTSKTPAQPYLRPALEKNFPQIVRMIRAALRSAS